MPTRRRFLITSAATVAAAPTLKLAAQSEQTEKLPPSIAALTNRRAEAVPITLAEREHRLDRARALMHQNSVDAIVITTGTSLTYFTGLRWGQSERLFAWTLPATGAPFIVCPVFEEGRVRERMDAKPATLPSASITRVYTWNEDEDPYQLLAKALKDSGVATGRIGIEERTQFVFADGISHASPALTTTSATPVTFGCRAIKSPAELALMQLANNITLSVYKACYQSAQPGMTNRQFSQMVDLAYTRCGVTGDASCQVGEYSALPHGSLQPQIIREAEIILIDDGCTVEGYQSDISRTFVLGDPTIPKLDKARKVFDIVLKAQSAALAAGHPGAPCHTVDAAARDLITAAGYGPDYKYFTHRLGHGIGMDGHEWPYLVRGNTTPLAAGMCFSDEPGIYLPGEFGVRLEDDWHVTEDGGKMFTPQSPSLEHPFG
ncbi:Xaa-Pro peptidase family protein [Tunturiibacter empetritectus]|uniref:Xaa-Pro dipeptidase n=1 Tax=Tunturiibacter lichenicola TaxID=2051959 RepID=A0A852VMR3_9BACT|nr:Xaa-Pro peptidase family protein [Edaphobacter lichenicola]NYF90682.1 Xaa-Pro dipeptidase [Edaphobacter lichenicola]